MLNYVWEINFLLLLKQGHIYHVLENPNMARGRRPASPGPDDLPPPVPAYCPAGGDSPQRDLKPQPPAGDLEYAEIFDVAPQPKL